MATNTYTYGSLGERWTVGDPTSKDRLDVARTKTDANRWTLTQLLDDADDSPFALANGTLATTQVASDNTTKIATTAYVTTAVAASTTSPGGSPGQVQYNNSGAFGGSANLTFDGSVLTVGTSIAATADTNTSIGFPGSDVMTFSTGGAEALRINAEGNIGIKTNPAAAWHTDQALIQLGTAAIWTNTHDETAANSLAMFSNNLYQDSADEWRYIVTDEATRYYQNGGGHYFDTAPSGSAAAAAGFTNRLKINSTRTTIWSSSTTAFNPDASTGLPSLLLHNNATDTDNQNVGIGFELGPSGSNGQTRIDAVRDGTGSATDMAFSTRQSSGNLYERMRISSSGAITFASFGKFQYLGSMTATTTWANISFSSGYSSLTPRGRAGWIFYVSFCNNNGAIGERSYGHFYYSGNDEWGSNFRGTITTPVANSGGYWGYCNLSVRINGNAPPLLQVQRSANTAQGWVQFYHMSVAGGNQVLG